MLVNDFVQMSQIQLNLVGQIGTKLKIGTSYNTQAAFDFDNIFIHFGKSFFKIKPTYDCSYLKIVLFEDKKNP